MSVQLQDCGTLDMLFLCTMHLCEERNEWPAENELLPATALWENFREDEQRWGWEVDPIIGVLENDFIRWIGADRPARRGS